MSRELLSLLALAFTHFQDACLQRGKLIPLTKQASQAAGMTMRDLENSIHKNVAADVPK